jgi:hypothetical protein
MSALRSLAFLLFQILVTPVYAVVMLSLFWIPRVPMYRIAASWCSTNLWGARWICGIRYRTLGAENIPTTPHVVMSKHSSRETMALTSFPPLRTSEEGLLSIRFRLGFARIADHDHEGRTDAMQQIVTQGRERFRQGFGSSSIRKRGSGRARAPGTNWRRTARHQARRADPAGGTQRRLPVAKGLSEEAGDRRFRSASPSDAGREITTLMQEVEAWIGRGRPLGRPRARG